MSTHLGVFPAPVGARGNWPLKLLAVGLTLALTAGVACKGAPASPTPRSPTAVPPTAASQPQPTTPLSTQPAPTPAPAPTEAGFFLYVLEPALESVVRSPDLTVKGTTTADAVVSVNGKVVPVDAVGAFSAAVTLQVGPNVIEVVASDFAGHQQSAILSAIYLPQ